MSILLVPSSFEFSAIFASFNDWWFLYLILIASVALVFIAFKYYKFSGALNVSGTKRLCHIAIFTAICAIINCFSFFPVSYISISLLATVCMVAGILYGARDGFIIGFLGDLIQAIVMPAGAYNPLIGLASGIMAVIPAIVFNKNTQGIYVKIAISSLLCLAICTAGLNTFGLWLFYALGKKSFLAYLFIRLPFQILVCAGNAIVSAIIIKVLMRIFPKKINENQ